MTTNSIERWINTAAGGAHHNGPRHGFHLRSPKLLHKWLYLLAIGLSGVWTLLMMGVYGLLKLSDEALQAGTGLFSLDAQTLEWLAAFVGGTQQLGGALVLIVWVLGLLVLALCAWIGRRLIRAFS